MTAIVPSAQLVEQYLRTCRIGGHSPATRRRRRNTLAAFARTVELARARRVDVETFLDRPLSRAARRAYLCDLRSFYAWARARKIVKRDPTRGVPVPPEPQGRPRPLDSDVWRAALRYGDHRVRLAVALGVLGGLRIGEIVALHRDDVLEGRGELRVVGKGDRERFVPIHPKVARLLAEAPDVGWLFPSPHGGHLRRDTLAGLVARHLRDYGPPGVVSHQLRHTFGTNTLATANGNVIVVAELLGHARLDTTRVYARPASGAARAAVRALKA